jgi:hypothetical protein
MATDNTPVPTSSTSNSLFSLDTTLLTLFYKDLAQPGVRQVGKAIGTVLGLSNVALLSVKLYSETRKMLYVKHLEDLRKQLEGIPEDEIVEVAPELGVPVLENLGKTTNEKLSQLYVNLLANASSIDFVVNTHPRFVSIIENITADEVLILEHLNKITRAAFINISMTLDLKTLGDDVRKNLRSDFGVGMLHERATMLERTELLSLPDKARFYFQNLEGLGLLRADTDGFALGDAYDPLVEAFSDSINQQINNTTISVDKGSFELTETGKLFLLACRPQSKK